jgi:receptor protein-tyrosine kinase
MSIIEKAIERLVDDDTPPKRHASQKIGIGHAFPEPSAAEQQAVSPGTTLASSPQSEPDFSASGLARADLPTAAGETAAVETASRLGAVSESEAAAQDGETSEVVRIYDAGLEGIISPATESSRTAEEFRVIKRPLLQRAFAQRHEPGEHPNVVVVTSSVAGEGKTFTSLNLAISIAMELDRTVLLVDSDLANPGLSRLLKVRDRPGLTERLLDSRLDLKQLLMRTNVPKLTLLPAGLRHRRSTELLASNVMRGLLDELANRYPDRIVLFDSPPLLATTEASVLANQAGQICIVVESGITPQFLVKEAVGVLQYPDRISLVLNKTKRDLFLGQDGYYGYRYGYGYGYGQGSEGAKT